MPKMRPYIVKPGDYVDSIADRFGFDPEEVWNDEKNKKLKEKRKNPNILYPGDLLFIPDEEPNAMDLEVGAANSYVADDLTATIKFQGPPNQAYRVMGLDDLVEDTSGADGLITLEIPTRVHFLWVHYPELGQVVPLEIGYMDPVHKNSGIQARLDSLGFGRNALSAAVELMGNAAENEAALLRRSIACFQAANDLKVTGEKNPATIKKLEELYGA